jgi:hypothetical protein
VEARGPFQGPIEVLFILLPLTVRFPFRNCHSSIVALYSSSFPRTGLNEAAFFALGLLILLPASADFLLRFDIGEGGICSPNLWALT